MNIEFNGSPLVIAITVVVLLVFLIVRIVRWKRLASERAEIEASPVLTVPAKLIKKRERTHSAGGDPEGGGGFTYTDYFFTFEMENGIQVNLTAPGYDFRNRRHNIHVVLFDKGDSGMLTYQGPRYIFFKTGKEYNSEFGTVSEDDLIKVTDMFADVFNRHKM